MNRTELSKKIGIRVKAIRLSKELTARQVATRAEMSEVQFSHIETGNNCPHLKTLLRVLSAMEISVDEFFAKGWDE